MQCLVCYRRTISRNICKHMRNTPNVLNLPHNSSSNYLWPLIVSSHHSTRKSLTNQIRPLHHLFPLVRHHKCPNKPLHLRMLIVNQVLTQGQQHKHIHPRHRSSSSSSMQVIINSSLKHTCSNRRSTSIDPNSHQGDNISNKLHRPLIISNLRLMQANTTNSTDNNGLNINNSIQPHSSRVNTISSSTINMHNNKLMPNQTVITINSQHSISNNILSSSNILDTTNTNSTRLRLEETSMYAAV
mmetsp:Transcript_26634/g.32340  ORF Transcript_26634/g.32340 Transcript_26634/m.32340 type:complete len:243 (-) Transcript_26634:94-822(-)